jgi:hypothetical protein
MPIKTKFVDEQYLINVPLPKNNGERYTIVSHEEAVKNIENTVTKYGYSIRNKDYKIAQEGQVAIGQFTLNMNDSEMGYMVGFINSYNKTKSFQYFSGSSVFACLNGLVVAENHYRRKHMGDVDTEAFLSFDNEMTRVQENFKRMIDFREELKLIPLSKREMAELAGRMAIEEKMLSAGEFKVISEQINAPDFDYGGFNNTLWEFYNHTTHAAKKTAPANYFKQHEALSNFVINEFGILQNKATIEEINYKLVEDVFIATELNY